MTRASTRASNFFIIGEPKPAKPLAERVCGFGDFDTKSGFLAKNGKKRRAFLAKVANIYAQNSAEYMEIYSAEFCLIKCTH